MTDSEKMYKELDEIDNEIKFDLQDPSLDCSTTRIIEKAIDKTIVKSDINVGLDLEIPLAGWFMFPPNINELKLNTLKMSCFSTILIAPASAPFKLSVKKSIIYCGASICTNGARGDDGLEGRHGGRGVGYNGLAGGKGGDGSNGRDLLLDLGNVEFLKCNPDQNEDCPFGEVGECGRSISYAFRIHNMGGPGGSGGVGGNGFRGRPASCSNNGAGNGGDGGSGGRGGNGGNGGRISLVGKPVQTVEFNSLDFNTRGGSRGAGGKGGNGGPGGQGKDCIFYSRGGGEQGRPGSDGPYGLAGAISTSIYIDLGDIKIGDGGWIISG